MHAPDRAEQLSHGMAQHQQCQSTAAGSFQEARQLVQGLTQMLSVLGPAYTELSGQAAGAQNVVLNLQHSLAYLHVRAGQEPSALPWMKSLPAAGLLSTMDMPQRTPPAGQPQDRQSSADGALTHAGSQPTSTTRSASPSTLTSCSIAISKQAGAAGPRATAGGRKATAMANRVDTAAGTSRSRPPMSNPASKAVAAPSYSPANSLQGSNSTSTADRDPLQPLNLPRVADYQLDSSGRYAGTISQQLSQDGRRSAIQPAGPGPPPQLPAAFVKAEREYLQTLLQCQESCRQAMQGHQPHSHKSQSTLSMCTPLPPWSEVLQGAGSRFGQALGSYCQQSGTSVEMTDLRQLRHEAQVSLAALVAAYTWVLQSLLDLMQLATKPAGIQSPATSPPPDLQCVMSMLKELPVLQQEYDSAVAAVQVAEGTHGSSMCDAVSDAQPVCTNMQLSLISPADRVAAAARWRNRFLRAMLQPVAAAGKPTLQGRHTGPSTPSVLPQQSSSMYPSLHTHNGMVRPLCLWLPDIAWSPLHSLVGDQHSRHLPQVDSGDLVDMLLSNAPWLHALPLQLRMDAAVQQQLSVEMRASCVPAAALSSTTALASLARNRAIMQLQYHLMQLWLEQSAEKASGITELPNAARRLVSAADTAAQKNAGSHAGARNPSARDGAGLTLRQPSKQVDRFLASVRLAHLLTAKNAWNRTLTISQQDEDTLK